MKKPGAGQLAHTCIRVKDMAKTIAFYNGLLGMPIVEQRERMVALGAPENYLEVFPWRDDQSPDNADPQTLRLNHICLWVEGIEELEKRAAAAGSPFTGPIGQNTNWVQAAIRVGWVVDPDGNRVELLEWTGPAQT
jgi:lactoylglutathione lyase